MSVKETPLARVKRIHGTKENLVDSLVKHLEPEDDESKGELKQRLMAASNKKLLRLSRVIDTVNSKYGGRDQLVDALCATRGKSKDADFANKLHTLSLTRLLDLTNERP